jgi:hypothetical protein
MRSRLLLRIRLPFVKMSRVIRGLRGVGEKVAAELHTPIVISTLGRGDRLQRSSQVVSTPRSRMIHKRLHWSETLSQCSAGNSHCTDSERRVTLVFLEWTAPFRHAVARDRQRRVATFSPTTTPTEGSGWRWGGPHPHFVLSGLHLSPRGSDGMSCRTSSAAAAWESCTRRTIPCSSGPWP